MRSPSHSNPCRGAGSAVAAGLTGFARGSTGLAARLCGALTARFEAAAVALAAGAGGRPLAEAVAAPLPAAAAALRAAARRGLDRCGRVRGSCDKTPAASPEVAARVPFVARGGRLLSFGALIAHIIA
jgi:hypothetical protein